jgi:hypothetical protein
MHNYGVYISQFDPITKDIFTIRGYNVLPLVDKRCKMDKKSPTNSIRKEVK